MRPCARSASSFGVLALLLALVAGPAAAQRRSRAAPAYTPRFGIGFDATVVPDGNGLIDDGLGVGLHGRIALPLNADLSAGVGMGLDGFVLSGSDEATYLATPEATLILTLPRRGGGVRYLMGGLAGYVPLTDGGGLDLSGGPALLAGAGWAFPLRETSFYVEAAPALIIGRRSSAFALPLRAGVIF